MSGEATEDPAAEWARSGVVSLTGHSSGPPLVPPGNAAALADHVAARLAAATEGTSHAVRVDGGALLAERAALTGSRREGRVSSGGAARLLPTYDGWAAVSCARRDDHQLLSALVGADLPNDPWPEVRDWLREHTGAELSERAAMLGLAAAPVDPASVPAVPTAGPPRSVAGLLVIDFSAMWAGPLCAHLLGLAGARVIKVETPQRLDGARHGNQNFYRLLHAGHRAVLLDPASAAGRRALAALVAAADIVIEGSRPRALAAFGIDAQAFADQGTIWVSITAAGRNSQRVGFGDDIAASAGLVAYDSGRLPVFCGDALADPLTGLIAAELALVAPRDGRGVLIDVSMTGLVAATLSGPATNPSPAARRSGSSWVIDTTSGRVQVSAPRARAAADDAPRPGEHTDQVLGELRIRRP
jgi:hypothetical protein